jgi:nucleotide-binding universal stress UspA family protein
MIASETLTHATGSRLDAVPPRAAAPILVASDGSADSDAAFAAAREIARRQGARAEVVAMLESMPIVTPDFGLVPPPLELDEDRRRALAARVEYQAAAAQPSGAAWPVDVRFGQPARGIARAAHDRQARLIVMGLGHHGMIERIAGSETTLQVVRLTDIPVLAVAPDFDALPRRVLIATDFSPASIRAARAALTLVPDFATIYLVHVKPKVPAPLPGWESWGVTYDASLPAAFERLRAALDIPAEYAVETAVLTGDPVKEITRFAQGAEVELIATGAQGHDFFERLLVGSVATGLLRAARCSVLVAPTPSRTLQAPEGGERRRLADPAEWAQRLEELTARNAGRRAMLETDDPELGAQAQGSDYPFLGAAYDRRDRRVELMFGDERGERHLMRGIAGATAIDILEGADGNDRVVRIAHGKGQTLLTFTQ